MDTYRDPVCPARLDSDTDPVWSERLDPDPVCPERLDPDPVNIRPDPKPWLRPCRSYIYPHVALRHDEGPSLTPQRVVQGH